MRRSATVAVALAAAFGCSASPAVAEPRALATVAANIPISAEGGWVAWSVPGVSGWRLTGWHEGVGMTLPVAPRPFPFDLDLGTDARGRTVATFSRCIQTPAEPGSPYELSTGCRVRVLDLATGQERGAGVPRSAGSSDTTPSMWRGRVAFARYDRWHRNVEQVMMWSPRTRRLTRLRHGAIPSNCPFRTGCRGMPVRGTVEGLDMGARLVTFLWGVEAPAVIGHGGWEVRADRLANGRSVLTGSGFLGEVCTGGSDSVVPSSPVADGNHVWFSQLRSSCYVNRASVVRFDARRRRAASGAVPGEVLRFAKDDGALYALVAPKPPGEARPACDAPGAPCTIERLDRPALTPLARRPGSPFF